MNVNEMPLANIDEKDLEQIKKLEKTLEDKYILLAFKKEI